LSICERSASGESSHIMALVCPYYAQIPASFKAAHPFSVHVGSVVSNVLNGSYRTQAASCTLPGAGWKMEASADPLPRSHTPCQFSLACRVLDLERRCCGIAPVCPVCRVQTRQFGSNGSTGSSESFVSYLCIFAGLASFCLIPGQSPGLENTQYSIRTWSPHCFESQLQESPFRQRRLHKQTSSRRASPFAPTHFSPNHRGAHRHHQKANYPISPTITAGCPLPSSGTPARVTS
jgi:hypothetical protein